MAKNIPILFKKIDLARIRTWNLLIRSQTRYPLRHKASDNISSTQNKGDAKFIFAQNISEKAQTGFEPVIFGLRDRRLTTWPLRQLMSRGKHSFHFINFSLTKVLQQNLVKVCGSGGIRTHASEETGALNQRLRPLGHATYMC